MSATFALFLALLAPCLAQPLEFDAASLKPVDPAQFPRTAPVGGPGSNSPGRYSTRTVLIDLLKTAYDLPDDRISGAPDWLRAVTNLYQLDATMPPDTTRPAFQAMLQNLLVRRFHLAVHREARNFPAFDLVVAKTGPKLPVAATSPVTDSDGFPVLPPGPHIAQVLSKGNLRLKFQEKSMADLAALLGSLIDRGVGPGAGVKLPRVTDKTGLTARYNFTLEFACGSCVASVPINAPPEAAPPPEDGPTIFAALEKQLGLKVVKAPDVALEVLVIDRIDRIPTAN